MNERLIGIVQGAKNYPINSHGEGFSPSIRYPEYPFTTFSTQENEVYGMVRELLHKLGLDSQNYGTPNWNPLGDLITPGDKVVLKPNFVRHHHRLGLDVNSVITHASIIRPIMDYAYLALQGKGELTIADAPQGDTNFEQLLQVNGVDKLMEFYKQYSTPQLPISLVDLRKEWTPYKHGIIWDRIQLPGDPKGYVTVALDDDSEFITKSNKNYYGADPDRARTQQFHKDHINRYNVARTILDSDVFISIPKLKVHRKVGVTLNIKNLIGINGEKNFLPHFTVGSPKEGGDEFSNDTWNNKVDRKLKDLFLWKNPKIGKYLYLYWHVLDKLIFRKIQPAQNFVKGDWYGNDTTWRAAVDLAKIILYADSEGTMHSEPQRKYLSIIDGVIAGEKEGPLTPDPFYSGIVMGGFHPTSVDIAATHIMGLDYKKIKMLAGALGVDRYSLSVDDIENLIYVSNIDHDFSNPLFQFTPPAGWIGHLELPASDAEKAG